MFGHIKTEQELFQEYRKAIIFKNKELAEAVLSEYRKRGYTKMNGEDLESVFKRNPILKEWYEKETGD